MLVYFKIASSIALGQIAFYFSPISVIVMFDFSCNSGVELHKCQDRLCKHLIIPIGSPGASVAGTSNIILHVTSQLGIAYYYEEDFIHF